MKSINQVMSVLIWCVASYGCSADDVPIKKESVDQTDIKTCLTFVKGLDKNKINEYVPRSEVKRMRHDPGLHSSTYDLNDDGDLEYFYYIDEAPYCGMESGCYTEVLRYSNKKFHELIEHGIATFNKINPMDGNHNDYVCIMKTSTHGWHDLLINRNTVFKYSGKYYTLVKQEAL